MPNPTIVAATKNNGAISAAQTSVSVTSTGSVTAGNLQIVAIVVAGAVAPTGITPPGGWSTILATTVTETSGLVSAAIFYKQAAASGSFTGSFSWTSSSTGGEWLFTEWSGAGASFIDGAATTNLNASSTSPTSPAITPGTGNVNDTLVGLVFGGVLSVSTVSIPAGMTSILASSGSATQPLLGAASLNLASSGAAGAETWTLGTAQAVLGVSFLIQQGPTWGWLSGGSSNAASDTTKNVARARYAATKGKSEFGIYSALPNMEWVAQPPQPPRFPKTARYAAIMPKEDGNEGGFANWRNFGWEIQPPPPPHVFLEKRGAFMRGDDGIAATKTKVVADGWEIQPPPLRHVFVEKRGAISTDEDGNESPIALWRNAGWEVQPPPPPHIFREKRGAVLRGDDGAQATKINWFNGGWEIQPVQPGHPRPERSGAVARGDEGDEAVYVKPAPPIAGWEIQPSLLSIYPKIVQRGTATKGKSEFAIYSALAYMDWMLQPPQPPHPFREKRGAVMHGPVNVDAVKVVVLIPLNFGWEVQFPQLPRYPKTAQRAAGASGESQFAAFNLTPWDEDLAWQPFRVRRERAAPLIRGDDGSGAPLTAFRPAGWEIMPTMPRRRPERAAGWLTPPTVIDAAFANFFPLGWPVAPPQPNHPRREMAGALMRGDDGNEGIFTFQAVPIVFGFDGPRIEYRPRIERSGAVLRGDDGIGSPFGVFRPSGWESLSSALNARRTRPSWSAESFTPSPPRTIVWGFDADRFLLRPLRRTGFRNDGDAGLLAPAPPPAAWGYDDGSPPAKGWRRVGSAGIVWSWFDPFPVIVPVHPNLCFARDFALWRVVASSSLDGKQDVMGTYEIDTALEVIGTFADSLTGQMADPTAVQLFVRKPNGVVLTLAYPAEITKNAVGSYSYEFVGDISGTWTYKWRGIGAVVATSPDATIVINSSSLIPG